LQSLDERMMDFGNAFIITALNGAFNNFSGVRKPGM